MWARPESGAQSPLRKACSWPHQPYVSLRSLASLQNMGYLALLYMLLYMWQGTGLVAFVLIVFFLVLLLASLRAVVSPNKLIVCPPKACETRVSDMDAGDAGHGQ